MKDPRFWNTTAWAVHQRASADELAAAAARGRAVAEGSAEARRLVDAREVLAHRGGVWQAFHDAFVASAQEQAARTEAWATTFELVVDRISAGMLPQFQQGGQLHGISRMWASENDAFNVWRHRNNARGGADMFDGWLALLVRLSPVDGLRVLDALPHPTLMNSALESDLVEDRELIEQLVVAAPEVFDAAGTWVPTRSVAALLIVNLVLDHVATLRNILVRPALSFGTSEPSPDDQLALQALFATELPAWMRRAFEKLLGRTDGRRIAIGYLGHLAQMALSRGMPESTSGQPAMAEWAALSALAQVMGNAGIDVGAVREVWQSRERLADARAAVAVADEVAAVDDEHESCGGEGARTLRIAGFPIVYGAACLPNTSGSAVARDAWWSWFCELLEGRDPGLEDLRGEPLVHVPQQIGRMLSEFPGAAALFQKLYTNLEPQRRRAGFIGHGSGSGHRESVLALRVALAAAAEKANRADSGADAAAAREWFGELYALARRVWLTSVSVERDANSNIVTLFFSYASAVFGGDIVEALTRMLPPIANDCSMVAHAAANARINGLDPNKVADLFGQAGVDLRAALRDAHHWAELSGRDTEFPDALAELAAELDLGLPTRRPLPGSLPARRAATRIKADPSAE